MYFRMEDTAEDVDCDDPEHEEADLVELLVLTKALVELGDQVAGGDIDEEACREGQKVDLIVLNEAGEGISQQSSCQGGQGREEVEDKGAGPSPAVGEQYSHIGDFLGHLMGGDGKRGRNAERGASEEGC